MSVITTFLGTFAARGAGFVLSFLTGVVTARALFVAGKGEVDVLVAFSGLFLLSAYPSLEEPQLYLIGRRERPPGVFFANGFLAVAGFGALAIAVFEAVRLLAPEWLSTTRDGVTTSMDLSYLRVLVAMVPLVVGHRVWGGILQGLRDMRSFNLSFLIQALVLFGGVLVLVVGFDLGVGGAVAAHAASMAAGGLSAAWFCWRHPEVRAGPMRPDPGFLLGLARRGLRIHGGVLAAFLILFGDQILLNHFRGAAAVGLYATAASLTGKLRQLVVQPIKEVVGSRLPGMVGEPDRMADALARTCRHTVLLVLIPGAALAAVGYPLLVLVYGEGFAGSYAPLVILIPGNILWALAVVLSYWFIGQDRLLTLTVVGLFIAAANLAQNLVFIPMFPEHAVAVVALTSVASYALHLGVFMALMKLGGGVSLRAFFLFRREDLSVYGDAWARVRDRLRPRRKRPPT